MATKRVPHLLDLPVELLCQIAANLQNEVLPTLRLACKTLEAATFDLFTDAFVKVCDVYILSEDRWIKVQRLVNDHPRLAVRLRDLAFTGDWLEGKGYEALYVVPEESHAYVLDPVLSAQCDLSCAVTDSEVDESMEGDEGTQSNGAMIPCADIVHSVLLGLAGLVIGTPQARISFELTGLRVCPRTHPLLQSVFSAAASAQLPIHSLSLDFIAVLGLTDLLAGPERQFLSCTASTKRVKCRRSPYYYLAEEDQLGSYGGNVRSLIVDNAATILHSVKDLRELHLDLSDWNEDWTRLPHAWKASAALLSANELSSLKELSLVEMAITSKDLLRTLSRCSSSLEELVLHNVDTDEDWSPVFRFLCTMPRLHRLYLDQLSIGSGAVDSEGSEFAYFGDVKRDWPSEHDFVTNDEWESIWLYSAETIAVGLRAILDRPQIYKNRYWEESEAS